MIFIRTCPAPDTAPGFSDTSEKHTPALLQAALYQEGKTTGSSMDSELYSLLAGGKHRKVKGGAGRCLGAAGGGGGTAAISTKWGRPDLE